MGLPDHSGSLQVPGDFALGFLLFGFALERQSLLQLFGDMEGVEVSLLPLNWLQTTIDKLHKLILSMMMVMNEMVHPKCYDLVSVHEESSLVKQRYFVYQKRPNKISLTF